MINTLKILLSINEKLAGYTISHVTVMNQDKVNELGWVHTPFVLHLTKEGCKDLKVIPQSDEEGNDGGALELIEV